MSNHLVTVATFYHPFVAHLFQGRLDEEGIESFIADEETVDVNWFYLVAVGWVKVQVREKDVARAIEIRRAAEKGQLAHETEPLFVCPRCGAADLQRRNPLWPTVILVTLAAIAVALPLVTQLMEAQTRAVISRFAGVSIWMPSTLFLFFMFFRKRWTCTSCGHMWKAR
jgi:hypothetical protein